MNVKIEKAKEKECHICGKMCAAKGFGSHVRIHLKRECFACEDCGKQFSSLNLLQRHMLKHGTPEKVCEEETVSTTDNKFENDNNGVTSGYYAIKPQPKPAKQKECYICGKMCLLKNIKNHIRNHLKSNCHNCVECGNQFTTKKTLEQHKEIHHTQFSCEICNKKFRNAHHVEHHTCINGKLKTYICETCGKGFSKPYNLKVHIRSHTKERNYVCDICNKRFMANVNLKKHYRKHLEETVSDGYKPKSCGQSKPKIVVSSRNGVWFCDVCSKEFSNKYTLERHTSTHFNDKLFECDICNKTFKTKEYLDHHYRTHDRKKSPERKFVCDVCFLAFGYKGHLKRHQLIHAQLRPFICKFCNKSFRQKFYLSVHMRIHTGEKPFKCTKCNKSFRCKSKVVEHEKQHMMPQHVCSICNKAYFYAHALNRHLITHTNLKPYVCDICHKGVTSIYSLKQHYLTHTVQRASSTEDLNDDFEGVSESKLIDSESSNNLSSVEETASTCIVSKAIFANEDCLQSNKEKFIKTNNFNDENDLSENYNDITCLMEELGEKMYKCKICTKEFQDNYCLTCHVEESFQKDSFRCCMCQQLFTSKEILLEHHKVHMLPEENIYFSSDEYSQSKENHICNICKKVFTNLKSFECHKDNFSNENSFKCCLCLQVFNDENSLLEHCNIHNNVNNRLLKAFIPEKDCHASLKKDLSAFDKSKLKKKPYVCEVCKKVFSNSTNLKHHTDQFSQEGVLKCCACYQIFYDKKLLLVHYNIHTISDADTNFSYSTTYSEEEKPIFCEICKQNFQNEVMLECHTNEFMKKGNFECCACQCVYSVEKDLLNHHEVHKASLVENVSSFSNKFLEVEKKPYLCEVCRIFFPTEELLACHKDEYLQENNFKCCLCQQVYSNKDILFEHYKIHEELLKKPHICFLNVTL